MRRFRLTLIFVVTSLVVIGAAAVIVNRGIGDLAEDNLIRAAEENTARDAVHMQAMLMRERSLRGMSSSDGRVMRDVREPMPLTLEFLASPEGLPSSFPFLLEGLNIVKLNLFDLNGVTVWSTDPSTIGVTKRESPLYRKAVTGGHSSKLATDHDVVHLDGVSRPIDVVETYVPLRETPHGEIIGVMELYRDIADGRSRSS